MSNDLLNARIEELESRLMHQEAAIEELTRSLLRQDQLNSQTQAIERLATQLQSMSAPHTLSSGEESPPPHY